MQNPRQITTNGPENWWSFEIPRYRVTDDGIISNEAFSDNEPEGQAQSTSGFRIDFCKGDKSDSSKERQEGVFVESLLEVCVQRLQGINVGELSTRETSVAITKIQEAIMWLEKRSADRKLRNVEQTYQK